MIMLDRAIELARVAHKGQVDKGGHPYINHPLRVMNAVETIEEKIVAVLHDAVEDSDLTINDLKREGFSEEIVCAIAAITKLEGEKRKDYLKRVELNKIALKVKIADMNDNADISRIPNPSDKDRERTRIYEKDILKLEKKLNSIYG